MSSSLLAFLFGQPSADGVPEAPLTPGKLRLAPPAADAAEVVEDLPNLRSAIGSAVPEEQSVHVVTLLQPRTSVDRLSLSSHGAREALPSEADPSEDDDLLGPVILEDVPLSTEEMPIAALAAEEELFEDSDDDDLDDDNEQDHPAGPAWASVPATAEASAPRSVDTRALVFVELQPERWSASDEPSALDDLEVMVWDDGGDGFFDEVDSSQLRLVEEALDDGDAAADWEAELDLEVALAELADEEPSGVFQPMPLPSQRELDGLGTPDEPSVIPEEIALDLFDDAPHSASTVDLLSLPDEAFVPGGMLRRPLLQAGSYTGIPRAARRAVVRVRAGRHERDHAAA